MERRVYMQIPGPTNIPLRVLRALSTPNLNHRGSEFMDLALDVISRLKAVYQTGGDVLVFPGSGTGGLEAAVVNTLSPGDRVLSLCNGAFSSRFGDIAEAFGMNVRRLEFDWRDPVDPEVVGEALEADPGIKAVLVTHNETSTGVLSDVGRISRLRCDLSHAALILVDAVSSLGCEHLPVDDWGLDIVVSGCQKGLMLPPGLAVISVSDRAWSATRSAASPRWYWDFAEMKARLGASSFPYTPAQSLFFGLREALAMILEEGLGEVFGRHRRLARGMRGGMQALGLDLFGRDGFRSSALTAALVPEQITFRDLAVRLRDGYGVVIGGGLGRLEGRVFRIAHMGAFTETEVLAVLAALECALADLGVDVEPGVSAPAARKAMLEPTVP